MFDRLIVPLDGSKDSARGLEVARVVSAAAGGVPMTVVGYALPSWLPRLRGELAELVADVAPDDDIEIITEVPSLPMGEALAALVDDAPTSLVVMSTHGRGRSEALVGSVANSLLRHTTRPVLLVGPACEIARFDPVGPVTVPLDGTRTSEAILPIAAGWATRFDADIELVSVLEPSVAAHGDGYESAGLARARRELRRPGDRVGFDVLHDTRPSRAIVDRAEESKAALVAMATHGAEGLSRITAGSVTSAVTRHAPCPVLVVRPVDHDPHHPRSVS